MYECLAENGVGDAVSAEAQLRVYEGTYLPPSPFLFSTLTIVRAKLVDSEGLETARDPIPHGSIRRYRHYRGGDGGGNLIFNERVAGTGGGTHDRPKVSTTRYKFARRAGDSRQKIRGRGEEKDDRNCERRLCNEPNSVEIKPSLSSFAIGSTSAIYLLFLFIRKSEQLNGAQFGDQAEGDVIEKKTPAHLESLPFSGKNLLNFRETP